MQIKWRKLIIEPNRGQPAPRGQDAMEDGPYQGYCVMPKMEGEDQAWQVSAPKHKGKKRKQPVVTTRASSRIP